MYCSVHCRFTAAAAQSWCSLERENWLRRSLFQACTRLNPRTCIALSTAVPAAQCAQSWCSLEREWLRPRCFSIHTQIRARIAQSADWLQRSYRKSASCCLEHWADAVVSACIPPQSTHMHLSIFLRFTAAQCSTSLGAACVNCFRRSLFQHAHASIHAHAFTLSTADSLQLSAAPVWCSLEREWLRRSLFQHAHASIHAHAFALSTAVAGSVQHSLGAAWSVSGYDARCFSIPPLHPRHALLSPLQLAAAQCSKSWCCLGDGGYVDARCFACIRLESTHMHCQSTADSLQLSAAQSWCSLEREWLRRSLFQHTRLRIHAHALLCPL
jgi:hypothetical protein